MDLKKKKKHSLTNCRKTLKECENENLELFVEIKHAYTLSIQFTKYVFMSYQWWGFSVILMIVIFHPLPH